MPYTRPLPPCDLCHAAIEPGQRYLTFRRGKIVPRLRRDPFGGRGYAYRPIAYHDACFQASVDRAIATLDKARTQYAGQE